MHNPSNVKHCPVCNKQILSKESQTCSYACSNTMFRHGNEGGTQYRTDRELIEAGRYRDICFRHHEKKCVYCGEDKIVAVHHLNDDSSDHRPENLIPLCPTHHEYWHSQYRHIVEDAVNEYIRAWESMV